MAGKKLKPGQEAIANARLEVVENRYPHRDYEIDISLPEFTCLCPISGYPDFAVIHVTYVPDQRILELKSLKLYINQFRERELFHEETVNLILEELVQACQPRWMRVIGDFNARGNVKTVITARYPGETSS